MSASAPHDLFPASRAYAEMQALRIPSGWMIVRAGMAVETDGPPGLVSTLFNATHAGRRFNIDVEVQAGAGARSA